MAERFKAPVLKTGVGATPPWVRIPPSPPVAAGLPALILRHVDEAEFAPPRIRAPDIAQDYDGAVGERRCRNDLAADTQSQQVGNDFQHNLVRHAARRYRNTMLMQRVFRKTALWAALGEPHGPPVALPLVSRGHGDTQMASDKGAASPATTLMQAPGASGIAPGRLADIAIEVERLSGIVRAAAPLLSFNDEPSGFAATVNKKAR